MAKKPKPGEPAMAWKAELVVVKKDQSNVKDVFVDVRYYDEANSAVTLHFRQFHFPAQTTNAEMRRAVEDEGKRAKLTYDKSVSLAASFPPGTIIDIPA